MNLKESLESTVKACICNKCQDEGCRVKLDTIGKDHLVLSGIIYKETYHYGDNLCDFIIFDNASSNPVTVSVIELKNGSIDEKEFERAFKQLKNGALIADRLASSCDIKKFNAYLVKSGAINSMAARMLLKDKYKVTFRSISKYIRTLKCGDSFPNNHN